MQNVWALEEVDVRADGEEDISHYFHRQEGATSDILDVSVWKFT